jgi:hypothetical protein
VCSEQRATAQIESVIHVAACNMPTMLKNEYPLRCVAREGAVSVWLYDILPEHLT